MVHDEHIRKDGTRGSDGMPEDPAPMEPETFTPSDPAPYLPGEALPEPERARPSFATSGPKEHYNPGSMDLLGDVIQTPVKAFSYLASSRADRIGLAVVVYVVSQIPSTWGRHPFGIAVQSTPLRLLGNAASALISFAFIVGVIHLFARMLGGRNRYAKLFQAYGIALLPQLLTSPFIVWFLTTGSSGLLQTVIGWGTNIWLLVLQVIAIREVYNFSTARAIGAMLLPALIVGILFGLLVGIFMALGIDFGPVPDVF